MNQKLKDLAEQIAAYQAAQGLSDAELYRRLPGLGSTKTYKLILAGDTGGLDEDRWLEEYQTVINYIAALQSETASDPIYDDLPSVKALFAGARSVFTEQGNNRVVIVLGEPGTGKTVASRLLAGKFGKKIVLVEADETWKRESLTPMLSGVAAALGLVPPVGESRILRAVIECLNNRPVCLVFDEAHHCGPRALNIVKSLINQTRCQIVLLAKPDLWTRLTRSAYSEAQQIVQNRLSEIINLAAPKAQDVSGFIGRRLEFADGAQKACAEALAKNAKVYGNWNFVNQVCRHATELAPGKAIDPATFAAAITRAQQKKSYTAHVTV